MGNAKNEKIGKLISDQRKAKNLTQKDLADQLGVTDKAVSKWERGLSYPDISLLSGIANILGITIGELLNGEKEQEPAPAVESVIETTLHYVDTATKSRSKDIRMTYAIIFSALFAIGILACTICNFAVSGNLTWALFPISSIVYAWAVGIPLLVCSRRGILVSLIVLSLLTIPFLFVLETIIGNSGLIMPIGMRTFAVGILYVWIIYILFSIKKLRNYVAAAISFLLGIPLTVWINFIVAELLGEPRMIDIWDTLSCSILAMAAIAIFIVGFLRSKKIIDFHRTK